MNFVFIIDTSLSMGQTIDSISYLDTAKSTIKKFICDREYNNYQIKRTKYDKYFLLTFSDIVDEKFCLNSWACSSNIEQILFQLNTIKISYDIISIETVIQNSFKLLNFVKKIGPEKHVYGRLFNKIQNSIIILITDGGYITNNENYNLSSISLKDNNPYIVNDKNNIFPNIFKDLFRWDQRFFALVLTNKNDEFESFKVLDKICKNVGGKIITLDNANLLSDKLAELNKSFYNTGALINFNINKNRKRNYIAFLEYNGKIEDLIENEKWLFPDELIINNENRLLPVKNAIPIYELGIIKFQFKLPQEYYDKYEIKDKQFIFNVLIDGDCWNNLTIYDFLKENITSITVDILISEIKNQKIIKKPFAVLNFTFSKEILDQMNNTLSNRGKIPFNKFFYDYYTSNFNNNNIVYKNNQKNNNEFTQIKCEFLNLPYYYTELFSLLQNYKNKKLSEIEFKIDIEKYFGNIPFYYIKKIIKFLEKNKLKQFNDKDKEYYKYNINANFSPELYHEIEILTKIENDNYIKIHKLIEDNKNMMIRRRNACYFRDMLCEKNNRQYNVIRISDKEEDEQYLDFIDRAFQIDKLSNINQTNNININANNNVIDDKIGYNNKYLNMNEHEVDIELMGANREQLFRNDHLKSYLIPEIELRYLLKDYLFGNQFIQRTLAYSKQGITNNGPIQNDTIFNYINDEDYNIMNNGNLNQSNINKTTNNNTVLNNNKNNIKNQELISALNSSLNKIANMGKKEKKNLINNKRNRDEGSQKNSDANLNESVNTDISSSSDPQEPMIFNDNYSESDGSNDLMLDEYPNDNKQMSKMTRSLLEEFNKSFDDENNDDGIKLNISYEISKEKLNKWKFQKKIKNFAKDLINSIHNDGNDIIKIINKVIDQNYYAPDKKMTYLFIEKVFNICKNYGVNQMVQAKLKNLMKCYS